MTGYATGEYDESDKYISVRGNIKKHLSFWQNIVKVNETLCDILENLSNSQFSYISLNFKKPEFVDGSIKEMSKAHIEKVSLAKTKVRNSPFSVNKKKERLILGLRYVRSHVCKVKIKFDDWRYFQNFLECNKDYFFKFDLKSGYYYVDIFTIINRFLGLAGKLIRKSVILFLRF